MVMALGARPGRQRRLQRDVLVDTVDGALASRGCALRVRDEDGAALLTFKGPVVPGPFKVREEIETPAESPERLLAVLDRLGYAPVFRYEKFREEYLVSGAVVAIDETPIGTFVEIEGTAEVIDDCARRLGRTPSDYVTASYRSLFLQASPNGESQMTFAPSPS